jgi:RNA polymerase sigma-70 factor (ECF subfamily)
MELQDSRNEYFMKLYEPHHASALAYARRLAENDSDARDLLHDALENAIKAFSSLRKADSFKPWLFRIVRNNHLNRARRQKISKKFEFYAVPESTGSLDERAAERAKLSGALAVLSAEEREALILFEVEGFQIKEIAKLQRRAVQTIKYRLRQARDKLRTAYFSDTPPPAGRAVPVRDDRGG